MFKSARSRLRAAVFACAAALGLGAYAVPTATAVWRSNLGQSYTIGGNTYGVTIPGNETKQAGVLNADGTITVTNEWTGYSSPYIGLSGANPTAVSMLVKFSGLSIPESDNYGVCLAAMRDSSGNEVGAVVKASSTSLKAYYMVNGANGPTEGDVTGGENVVTQSGYMLFSYSTGGGVKIYVGSDIASLAGGAMGSYKYGSNTIERFSIGGDPAGKVYTPSGMIIEEVALFVGSALTNTDVADYAFPTLDGETTALTMTELNTKIAADSNVIFTASPVVTLDVEPLDATKTYLQSAAWNGTVLIKDEDKNNIEPTAYGNPNSTLKLSGVKGYFAKAKYGSSSTPAIELEDSETEGRVYGFWNYDGYSFNSYSGYPYVHTPELKGSGSLVADKSNGLKTLLVVDKWSAFTGKLQLYPSGIVCFGTGLPELTDASSAALTAGSIRLSGTVPATIGTWTVGTAFTGSVLTLTTAADATTTAFLTDSTKWNGTCQLNWNHTGALDIVNYGNANSVVEIVSTFSAYPTQNGGKAAANLAAELKLSANWTVANGWDSKTTTFAKLSGTGNLIVNGASGGSSAIPYTITKIENFTGTLAGARGKFTIGTIVASSEPTSGAKLVNCTTTNAPVLDDTKVTYNGAEQDVALEFKAGDGIYVAVPATTVDITIPEVDNATVSVTTNGVAVTPVNGVVTVDIGATVVVTYTADEGYQLTGDAISFTASASTTTVDVSSISVAAIVANVTSTDGQTTTPYTSAASAIAAADDGETVTLLENTVTLAEILTISKSITIVSGNASETTITGSGLSVYPQLAEANLTVGANVTFGSQLRVTSSDATITYPTGSTLNYRPPSGYQSATTDNGNGTMTITFYQQVYVYTAGTNATLYDEDGNPIGASKPVAAGSTFEFTVAPAEGCALVSVTADNTALTPSEGKYSIEIGTANVSLYVIAGAAVVTGGESADVYCSSLAAAVAAAENGQTVKLLADVTLTDKLVVSNKTVTITADSAKTITGQLRVVDGSNVMIGENVTITSDKHPTVFVLGDPAVKTAGTAKSTLVVNGTVLNTNAGFDQTFAIAGNGLDTKGVDITINGTVRNANGIAIYQAFPGNLVVNGTVEGASAISIKDGTLTVNSGAVVRATLASGAAYVGNNNGDSPTGDAIIAPYYDLSRGYGTPVVSIVGGEITVTDTENCTGIEAYDFEGATAPNDSASNVNVSGGTFNTAVADTYCAEGFEPKDNGDGTYGVRVDKGWIYEDADFPNYTGAWSKDGAALDLAYDSETGKAAIEDGATYTASKPSAGQLVTINLALSFDAANSDDDVHEGAKAAVRLGEGETDGSYVFQLYTTNELGSAAWLNAAASGVTPAVETDYEFTFVLDMTNRTYTVTVGNVPLTVDGAETLGFASANASDTVQSIEFMGAGKVASITGSYEDVPVPEGFAEDDTFGEVTLTAAQAEWLNGQGNYDALAAKISTMSQTGLNDAYLLNLNVLDENYDGTYEFAVTAIDVGDTAVTVTVGLTRSGALDGGINGTLKLMGGNQLPASGFEEVDAVTFSDADFSEGGTTTCTFTKGEDAAAFYQPVIVAPAVPSGN